VLDAIRKHPGVQSTESAILLREKWRRGWEGKNRAKILRQIQFAGKSMGVRKSLMNIEKFIKQKLTDIVLLLLAFLAIVVLLIKVGHPTGDSIRYRMFDVLYWLSVSYIPGYIIYFLISALPRRRDRKIIFPFVATQSSIIIGSSKGILQDLEKASGQSLVGTISKNSIALILENIDPNSNSPVLGMEKIPKYGNWMIYLDWQKRRTLKAIERVIPHFPSLDSEYVKIVSKIENCALFDQLDSILNTMPIRNADSTFLTSALTGYFLLIQELEIYVEKNMKALAWTERRH
jgi:hypothetical protein